MTRRQTTQALALMMAAGFSGLIPPPSLGESGGKSAPGSRHEEDFGSRTSTAAFASGGSENVKEVLRHELPDGKIATLVTVEYAPGTGSNPHRHPGPVIGYILEGAIVSQVEPGPPITYRQGQAFYEPPMRVHRVSRNASRTKPAKLLAFEMIQKGEPLLLPAPNIPREGRT